MKMLLSLALVTCLTLVGCQNETCGCPTRSVSTEKVTPEEEALDPKIKEAPTPTAPGPTGDYDPAMASVCQLSCGAKGDWEEADIVAQPGASVGALTRCAVSGAVFRVTSESPSFTVDGRTYYACCSGCAAKFKDNPERFVRSSDDDETVN